MEVRVKHVRGYQQEAYARFHRVITDLPFEANGGDNGPTPPELMLSALGTCAMHYAVEYLRARGLPSTSVLLTVRAEKGGNPVRLEEIALEIEAPTLGPRARAGVKKAIEACLLHQTLSDPPRVKIDFAPAGIEHPVAV
jgi:uncharacterized OsmC-like protein